MLRLHPFFFILTLVWSLVGHAAQVGDLYSSSVPVASQADDEKRTGFQAALEHVLVKVTGRNIAELPPTLAVKAESFIQSFSYSDNPDFLEYERQLALELEREQAEEESGSELPDESELFLALGLEEQVAVIEPEEPIEPPLPLILNVSFSPKALDRAVLESGVPIWGSVRPTVTVWAIYEEDGERNLLSRAETNEWIESLQADADFRALPLNFPAGDAEDYELLDLSDLWGLYPDAIDMAAERYKAKINVMLRLYPGEESKWDGNWVIRLGDQVYSRDMLDSDQDLISEQLLSDTAALLAAKYAVLKTQTLNSGALTIEVSNVNSFDDYRGLQDYINQLPPVLESSLKWISGGKAAFELTLAGQTQQFLEHIALDYKLTVDEVLSFESDLDSVLNGPTEYLVWSASF